MLVSLFGRVLEGGFRASFGVQDLGPPNPKPSTLNS